MDKVAIIGAGITGLTVADRLAEAGTETVIFDKSRGIGGRLATRRAGDKRFNHGAPQLHVTSADFQNWLAGLGITVVGGAATATNGMSRLLRPLADRFDIQHGVEITSVSVSGGAYQLATGETALPGTYRAVILTLPAPQAAKLAAEVAPYLSQVRMVPIWTLLVGFDAPVSLRPDAVTPPFDKAIAQGSGTDWVLHCTPDASRETLERSKSEMAEGLFDALRAQAGPLPDPSYLAAHRWRYAYADAPLGRPFAGSPSDGLLIGGDWALGPRAKDGWTSGRAMAEAWLSLHA